MSARRKHVRAHARDVEVEVDGENDLVCRVEEIKGGNVIEVLCTTYKHIIVFSLSHLSSISSARSWSSRIELLRLAVSLS